MSTALLERDPQAPAPEVVTVDWRRSVTLLLTLLPFAGFLLSILVFWGRGISWLDLGIMGVFYTITTLGVTVGYHRFFTHGSFEARKPTRIALALAGSLAVEGALIQWVATHRCHHMFSDKAGDPHSPHLNPDKSAKGILSGLYHAHMGWLFKPEQVSTDRFAPDMVKVSAYRTIDKLFPLWVVVSFFLPAVVGLVISGSWVGGLTALLWGGLVRMFLLHHVTYSINSICHYFGRRPFRNRDESTNNWLLSVFSFGESWHNNHHAFPSSARHGLRWYQVDIGGMFIWFLEKIGQAKHVRRITQKQITAKLTP